MKYKAIVEEVIGQKEEYSQQAEEVFITMIKRILMKKIGSEKANEIIKKMKGVDGDMLTSLATIEEENKIIFNNGIKSGIKSGIKTGIKQNKVEIIKNMLKENLTIDLISKVTGVTKKEINKMK